MNIELNEYSLRGAGFEECWQELKGLESRCADNPEGICAEQVAQHLGLAGRAPRAVITRLDKAEGEVWLTVAEYDHDWMPFLGQVAGRFGLEIC